MLTQLHQSLHDTVLESGLWDGGAGNREFLLSPSVYELPTAKATEIDALGKAVGNCFVGLNQIAAEATDPKRGHSLAWRRLRAGMVNGISKTLNALQRINPDESSMIMKLDLMEDQFGNFQIAEVDGYNPRGMGYSTLAARMASQVSTADRLPGVAASLSQKLRALGRDEITFLYGARERFYLPEFSIFRDEMAVQGITVNLFSELDFPIADKSDRLFVIFPQMDDNLELVSELSNRYRNGSATFLIPPKPYLGSKATLALLKNQEGDQELEKILVDFIDGVSLDRVRQYLPETYLVGRQSKSYRPKNARKMRGAKALDLTAWARALENDPGKFLLKECVSSGMKGVVFPDDPSYEVVLGMAANCQLRYVLQREVKQLDRRFEYFTSDGIASGTWNTRVTTHFIGGDLADIIVTARQDKRVHGSTDCLQLGTILV
jgi:hypothetical protein